MLDIKSVAEISEREIKERNIGKYSFSIAEGETREFNAQGGKFTLFRTLFDNSFTVTLFEEGKKGSAGTNRFEEEAVVSAIEDAHAAADASEPDTAWDIAPKTDFDVYHDGVYDADLERLFQRTSELLSDISDRHPRIIVEEMIVTHSRVHRLYKNSNGTVFERYDGDYGVELMYSAHEGEEATSFFSSGFTTLSLDEPFITQSSVEQDLTDVENQLHPTSFEGKFTGSVILPPSSLGSFLGSVIDNFLSDGVMLDGTSIWKDKLGQRVTDERISVKIDPYSEYVVCGERMTPEGFKAESYDLIKNGILENFKISLYVANKTGLKRTPCSSLPCIIEGGDKTVDEIISSVDRGIIVGRFSGGEPGTSGDFSGVAKNSFLVEGGKVVGAVSEVMISGNLADMFNNLVAISKETVTDGYGKMPYMAFDGICVSGK